MTTPDFRRLACRSLTVACVARRLLAEPVGLVFAAREPVDALQYLPELQVQGCAAAILGGLVIALFNWVTRAFTSRED